MLRFIKSCIAAIAISVVAGCAGTPFTFDEARQVKVGMTENQLYEIMGSPYMVVSQEDGQRFVYTHATAFGGAKSVSFDTKDGKVTKVPHIPNSFLENPNPDE